MTPYLSDIHDPISDTSCAMTGALKGPPITSSHSGSVIGDLLDAKGNFVMDAKIKRVVYFKNATRRLLSVSLLEKDGWNFESNKGILSRGKTVIPLVKTGGLYVMRVKKSKKTHVANAVSPARNDFMLWLSGLVQDAPKVPKLLLNDPPNVPKLLPTAFPSQTNI